MQSSWDVSYLEMADWWANRRSKDPSTKVGAVIVRPDKTPASFGFNGFPRGLSDAPELYEDRDYKLAVVVHAEENAILMAREPLHGCTIYVSRLTPCAHCASLIIQSGITRVVAEWREIPARWRANMHLALRNLLAAGVEVHLVDMERDIAFRLSTTRLGTFVGHGRDAQNHLHKIAF